MTARSHAVVLGGSMAGLAVARALCEHFERVSIIERDVLCDAGFATRKGLPQGNHLHGLSPAGYRVLEERFPGVLEELVAAGASRCDLGEDLAAYRFGCWARPQRLGIVGLYAPRSTLDAAMVRFLRRLPDVSLLEEHEVIEPVHDARQGRVTGVVARDQRSGAVRRMDADLIVDARGRGSLAAKWLQGWGYGEVSETHLRCDVGYTSAYFERRPGDCRGATGALLATVPPATRRIGAAVGVTQDRWLVSLGGWHRDYPPAELEGFRAFARSLPQPELYDVVKDREPLAPIHTFRFPMSRRCHFERLTRFPAGYLVVGDALCSFNPVYGHGMSVALLEAQAVDACLRKGDGRLARRFFARAARITAAPWAIAAGEDLRFPEVKDDRPLGFTWLARYLDGVQRSALRDPFVMRRFIEVVALLRAPAGLLAPGVAWRVARSELLPRRRLLLLALLAALALVVVCALHLLRRDPVP